MMLIGVKILKKSCHKKYLSTLNTHFGIYKVYKRNELNLAIQKAFKEDSQLIIERALNGREFSVAVLDDNVLGIIEIKYSENFYNYNAKYKNSKTRYIIPTDINISTKNKLEEYALKAHKALGCRGLTRSDFRLPINQLENPVLLEINTSPGLTSHSLVPKIANNSGLSYDELIAKILYRQANDLQ